MTTLKDIAKAANVSVPAVSSVFSTKRGNIQVSAKTRQRILETGIRLNYVKNDLARSVRSGVSNFIAFVDAKIGDSEHSSRILDGIVESLQDTEYFPKFFPYRNSKAAIDNISTLFGQKPAGVLTIARSRDYMKQIGIVCAKHNIPQITIGQSDFFGKEIIISTTDSLGQASAVEYLHKLGHRRIGHLSGSKDAAYSQRRVKGYMEGMNKCDLSANITVLHNNLWHGDNFNYDIENKIQKFLRETKATALTCVSDPYAMVAIRAANRIGLRVPEDISIIGHANYSICEYSNPPLTSIAEPFEEMGKLAAKELLKYIKIGKMPSKKEIKLPTHLFERESVSKVKI